MNSQHGLAAQLAPLIDALLDQLAERTTSRLHAASPPDAGDAAASPWMNITTAAAHLDWPKQRLYKLCAARAIPHYKQDGRLLFRRDELDTWLAHCAQGDRPRGGETELC